MAAKCNLLRSLTQNGTFFMFSEYAENLTKSYVQENQYRVIPSRYAMLDLNFDGKDNQYIGEIFQNYYENACSAFRKQDSSILTNGKLANELLWKTLYKYGLISIGTYDNFNYIKELYYIGELKLTPYEEIDGVGYNELWCYIDNDVHAMRYHSTVPENQTAQVQYVGINNYISGYDSTTYPTANADLVGKIINEDTGHIYSDNEGTYWMEDVQETPIIPYEFTDYEPGIITQSVNTDESVANEFKINTVIVFFDVYDTNSNTIYKNIPMGIYFTGQVSNSTLTNEITKVVSDETIYKQGTSYGLRINTKFVCTPQTTGLEILKISNLTAEEADRYCALLSSIANSQKLMEQMVANQTELSQSLKNHLASFANYKANVPYLRLVGGVNHWFVNGKDLGIASPAEKLNNLIQVDDYNNIMLTSVDGSKKWLTYNDFGNIVASADSVDVETKSLSIVNPELNQQVVGIDNAGNTNIYGLQVFDASTGAYQEILSYIKSTIRHDENLNIKFLIDGESSSITINTTDWTRITSIKKEGQSIIFDYLNDGDKISIIKYAGDRTLTPIILNYEYVYNGENSYYDLISYTTSWIPSGTTTIQNILKTQLGLTSVPTKIQQNYIKNFNYIYTPLYNYAQSNENHLFISFNAMNNEIFGNHFPDDTSKYPSDDSTPTTDYFELDSSLQISYHPTSDAKLYVSLPTFEMRRGCKDVYLQK